MNNHNVTDSRFCHRFVGRFYAQDDRPVFRSFVQSLKLIGRIQIFGILPGRGGGQKEK